jgi:hypothetical protein
MTSRELVVPRVLGTATGSIATATTLNLDFGTPDDLKVAVGTNHKHGDRIVVVITASTAGTTDSTSFSVQDAPDSSGSIGTPATAVTTTLPAAATGNQTVVIGVQLQPDRPWLRVRATRASGTTDTLVVRAVVLSVPHGI